MAKAGDELKARAKKYEKSNLNINGTFDDAMKVFFVKPKPGDELKTLKDKKNEASK
ncbi:MAG: hypothetical protein JWP37_2614 [Mucilaginibacter sp.]|nr:hypothetical protein [Mucilaginibacter sp.]